MTIAVKLRLLTLLPRSAVVASFDKSRHAPFMRAACQLGLMLGEVPAPLLGKRVAEFKKRHGVGEIEQQTKSGMGDGGAR